MNKLYLIVFFIGIELFADAQQGKINDSNVITEAVRIKELRFYPNPASTVINFDFPRLNPQRDLILQIYNFIGKKVYESYAVSQKATISLTDFFRGVYIFQLRDKSGRIVQSGKFQVSK